MWVLVTAVTPGGYVGELNSYPTAIDIEAGDEVKFQARHICSLATVPGGAA